MRRALRWDGVIAQKYGAPPDNSGPGADECVAIKQYIDQHRGGPSPFDLVAGGVTSAESRKKAIEEVRPYLEAGATWWTENIWSGEPEAALKRIRAGPPH